MVTHMKTTIEIADPLLAEAKREARSAGITLRELVESGLRRMLDERKHARRVPVRVEDGRVGGSGVRAGIREGDARQLRALANAGRGGIPEGLDEIDKLVAAGWGASE